MGNIQFDNADNAAALWWWTHCNRVVRAQSTVPSRGGGVKSIDSIVLCLLVSLFWLCHAQAAPPASFHGVFHPCYDESKKKYTVCERGRRVRIDRIMPCAEGVYTNPDHWFDEVRPAMKGRDANGAEYRIVYVGWKYNGEVASCGFEIFRAGTHHSGWHMHFWFVKNDNEWRLLEIVKVPSGRIDFRITPSFGPSGLFPFQYYYPVTATTPPSGFGFVDVNGVVVIKPEFNIAHPFSDGLALVARRPPSKRGRWDRYSREWMYIDVRGATVIAPARYDKPPRSFRSGRALIEKNGYAGFIDTTGKIVIPPDRFDRTNTTDFSEKGIARVSWWHDPAANYCYRRINACHSCLTFRYLAGRIGGSPFIYLKEKIRMYGVIDRNGAVLYSSESSDEVGRWVSKRYYGDES